MLSQDIQCPQGKNLLDILFEISQDVEHKDLKIEEIPNKLELFLNKFVTPSANCKQSCFDSNNMIYMTLPFWSPRLAKGDADEGDWLANSPIWIGGEGRSKIINLHSYIISYTIIRYIVDYGFTTLVYEDLESIPVFIKVEGSSESKIQYVKKNKILTLSENGENRESYELILTFPFRWREQIPKKGLCFSVGKITGKRIWKKDGRFIYQDVFEEVTKSIKNKLEYEFEDKISKFILDDFSIFKEQWEEQVGQELEQEKLNLVIKFLATHALIQNFGYSYFIPSLTHWQSAKGKNSAKEMGAGGLIIVLNSNTELQRNCLFCSGLQVNMKLRQYAIGEWSKKAAAETRKHGTRSAVAAIMARNMSHNIGSHVLSDLENADRVFCSYLQRRMDFIARISTRWPSWSMPLNLERDILEPLRKQSILWNRIVSSEGLNKEAICLKKVLTEGADTETSGNQLKELQVNVPGGPIGCHAVYSIVENFIRNSAKHEDLGSSRKMEIMSRITNIPDEDFYRFELWDNISTGQREGGINSLVKLIQNKLQKGCLIEETGELNREDWGLKEMAICAAYLNGESVESMGNQLSQFIEADKSEKGTLLYRFKFKKPKMFLIIEDKTKKDVPDYGIYFEADLNQEIEKGIRHQFLIIRNLQNLELTLRLIKNNCKELPARILIVAENDKRINTIEKLIEQYRLKGRVQVVDELPQYPDDNKNWEEFILGVYEKWLKKVAEWRKINIGKVGIILYEQYTEEDGIVRHWHDIRDNIPNGSIINLNIFYGREINGDLWNQIREEIVKNDKVILLDRHNRIRGYISDSGRRKENAAKAIFDNIMCLQGFGKGSTPTQSALVGEIIENIPGGFPASLFLLKLIESALYKVLIIDERIAQKTFDEREQFEFESGKRYNLKLAGCETATSVEMGKWKIELADREGQEAKDIARIVDMENKKITTTEFKKDTFFTEIEELKPVGELTDYQIVLIHQGVIDKLQKGIADKFENREKWIDDLRETVPYVFVHSGRGKPPDMPENVKFVEYSTIQEFTLQEISKYHLISTLFSISGE